MAHPGAPDPPAPGGWRLFTHHWMSPVGLTILVAILMVTVFGERLLRFDPHRVGSGPSMTPPGWVHLMGTDELGRDVFSRVVSGTRVSVLVGTLAALISTLVGVIVGAVSGFFGRWVDELLMRVTEIFQVIPRFFLAMMLVAFFGPSIVNLVLAIALLSWPQLARVVRSECLSLRSRQFVDAARVAGAGPLVLITSEILPNTLGPVIVGATLLVGQAIIIEAGLSYIGLGDPNRVSLGLMLQQAQQIMRTAWWSTAFPGLVIFLAVLSVNLVGDGLNDVFDPRSRERRR